MGPIKEESNFKASLRPILLPMQLLGIDVSGNFNRSLRIVSLCIVTILSVNSVLKLSFRIKNQLETNLFKIPLFNTSMLLVTVIIYNFCIHVSFVVFSVKKMAPFWRTMSQLDSLTNYDGQFYEAIRRKAWLGMALVVIYVSIFYGIKLCDTINKLFCFQTVLAVVPLYSDLQVEHYSRDSPYYYIMLTFYIVHRFCVALCIMLFMVLMSSMSTFLLQLSRDHKAFLLDENASVGEIIKIRKIHRLLCVAISNIHEAFQVIVIIFTIAVFVGVISDMFSLVISTQLGIQQIKTGYFLVESIMRLYLLAYINDTVTLQV